MKIDREFVAEVDKSRSNRAIVSAIVAMAHGLDLAVTAEGVETEAQVELLREQKCEEVQGFLFGRPAAVDRGTLLRMAEIRKIRTLPRPGASVTRAQVRKAIKEVMAERAEREAAEAAAKRATRRTARKTG